MKKYYKTLGLKEGATKQDIEKAFNKLSKEFDPKNNDNQDFFIEETKKLKQAYDKLMNISILSIKKVVEEPIKNEDINPNKNQFKSNNKYKKYLTRHNFIILLLLIIITQLFYLIFKKTSIFSSASNTESSRTRSRTSSRTNRR